MASPQSRKWLKRGIVVSLLIVAAFLGFRYTTRINWNPSRTIGQPLDSLDGVVVYYNGGVNQTHGRNVASDGYNVGIRYQCVEFVKRYYLEHFQHKMPDAYGHAKDFFDANVADGGLNKARGLLQFKNHGCCKPGGGDLLVWGPSFWNPYGHVAIVSDYREREEDLQLELIYFQQNAGPFGDVQGHIPVSFERGLEDNGLLGWLRMPN